jgi:lipoate-protein ligase A
MGLCRLIFDPPASGRRNMAVDEVLLQSAVNDGIATVRVYAWDEPTVSLGYFQRAGEIAADPKLAGLAAVRRLSGGGAILHHHEITYSLAIPATHPALFLPLPREPRRSSTSMIAGDGRDEGQNGSQPTSLTPDPSPAMDRQYVRNASRAGEGGDAGAPVPNPSQLYRLAHHAILAALAEFSVDAPRIERRLNGDASALRLRGDVTILNPQSSILNPRSTHPDPFLCFGRGDPNDIVLGSHKIVGSAQRRRRGAVLQHGSVLLRRSRHAEEYPGVLDLTGWDLSLDRLSEQIGRGIAESLGGQWIEGQLSTVEEYLAERLAREKYALLTWGRENREEDVPVGVACCGDATTRQIGTAAL